MKKKKNLQNLIQNFEDIASNIKSYRNKIKMTSEKLQNW